LVWRIQKNVAEMADGRLIIVIVEDDASMRQAIERLLLAADYNAFSYESAEAVGAVAAATAADCLILDIQLPGMSGFELYQTLRRSGLTISAIFISARDERHVRDEAERLGAACFLAKPFAARALLSAVEDATRRT
jgi:FixJ family two-component response regulator